MKKIVCVMAAAVLLTGCSQANAKSAGGSMTLRLEPNQKLEEITWKDADLWYLTRPMRSDEEAEVHIFSQSKDIGMFEGKVTIIETKEE